MDPSFLRRPPSGVLKIVLPLLFLSVVVAPAESQAFQLGASTDVFYLGGQVSYDLPNVQYEDAKWQSKLRFDFDALAVGAAVSLRFSEKIETRLEGWVSANDWTESESDEDWTAGGSKISSTSRDEMAGWGVGGKFVYHGMQWGDFSVMPTGKIMYERLSFGIYDLHQTSGADGTEVYFPGLISEYRQERINVFGGVETRWKATPWLSLAWSGEFSPFTYARNRDDHRLRSLESTGQGMAFCANTAASIEFVLFERLRIGTWAAFSYMQTYFAGQDQYWYGDKDPLVPRGTNRTGIALNMGWLDYRAGIRITVDDLL